MVTLTANPSLDRTLDPARPARAPAASCGSARSSTEPGGKGVNVARAIAAAGGDVVCVLPAADDDPIVTALHALGLELATVPVQPPVRTNYTLTEPDGTTTKLNEPGAPLDDADPGRAEPIAAPARRGRARGWSCPAPCRRARPSTGTPTLVAALRDTGARIAVDTSRGPAARAAGGRSGRGARPAQAQLRGARPAGRRLRGRDPARPGGRPSRPCAPCTTAASPRSC